MGALAVTCGIDRYLGALVTHDFRITPTGKFYYARASREEIWDASALLFGELGWGAPTAMLSGLAVGSAVTPIHETVTRWFRWLEESLDAANPGRNYSLSGLLEHHRVYVRCAASIASFLLAARATKRLRLSAADVLDETIAYQDKRVGEFPGNSAITVCETLQQQLHLVQCHCAALLRRLLRLGVQRTTLLCKCLAAASIGKDVPLIVDINRLHRPQDISTNELHSWWPADFALEPNWPRHFWQSALREHGLPSSLIDRWVRHTLAGCDPYANTSNTTVVAANARINAAVEVTLRELGIHALAGLSQKSGGRLS
ncbi:hypothetical protein GCM10025770_38270 [Viridibacterium curvum]|uniref:Uncharacterized protein n=2 Tax=Viridibacterium curvum TaxID=1101404 RepID=A0ABP9R714_9RHOO